MALRSYLIDNQQIATGCAVGLRSHYAFGRFGTDTCFRRNPLPDNKTMFKRPILIALAQKLLRLFALALQARLLGECWRCQSTSAAGSHPNAHHKAGGGGEEGKDRKG